MAVKQNHVIKFFFCFSNATKKKFNSAKYMLGKKYSSSLNGPQDINHVRLP